MNKKIILTLTLVLTLILVGCGKKENNTAESSNSQEDNKIVFGVTPVPHAEIVDALKGEFEKAGLDVEVVIFDDYIQPNNQLAAGDIDANFFQHEPYLKEFSEQNKLDITSIGNVHIEPMGLYSDKFKTVEEIEENSEIIIPNDPSNGARALIVLEDAGLIKLKDKTNLLSTEKDIVENPKNLKIVAMDAQYIPNAYKDAGAAIINSNFALGAGLNPTKDALVMEAKDSPYANLVAVRTEDKDKDKFKKLIEVLQSEESRKFIEEKYEGAVVAAF